MNNQRPYQNNYIYSQPEQITKGITNKILYSTKINTSNAQLTLKSLESMRERGLISEENYLKKLKELGF